MWLEHYLLEHPEENGFFCVSTSYRNEPNPVEGRHDKIFPMFEFELKGGIDELRKVEQELLHFLGFRKTEGEYPRGDYEDVSKRYGVDELEHEHEKQLETDHGPVFFLENFPKIFNQKISGIAKKSSSFNPLCICNTIFQKDILFN